MDKADELIKELLADYKGPEDLIGANGLMKRLTKKLVEGAMGAEMTHHLGYEKHGVAGEGVGNARNGTSPSQSSEKRRPARRGAVDRTASMLSALAARGYPETASQPSAMTCVAASLCSGVGNSMFA